jgi:nuclear GTP-binding protein
LLVVFSRIGRYKYHIYSIAMPKQNSSINKKSGASTNPNRTAPKQGMRSKSTIMRLNMYRGGKAIRNKAGEIVGGSLLMKDRAGGKDIAGAARIAPDRRWFGNTRTMSQTELDKFRDEMTTKAADPYSVVLRRKKIPMALLKDSEKVAKMNLLETESFGETFGKDSTRKRPKIDDQVSDYAALANRASESASVYETKGMDSNVELEDDGGDGIVDHRSNDLFSKGQSKRIWAELYKVLDSSDVILQVVDARNVPGTRCEHVEKHIKKNASHKQLVIVINKCDLVPAWVTRKWVKTLSAEFPTLAFHASITNAFGKGALISLLRQFGKLHADKRQISVGVIGYPNTGKSSVINALMGKKSVKAAPVPGETKVWQYITLMKRIFLIDSPGVVYNVGDDDVDTVLKGVVRAERLEEPTEIISTILRRVKREHIQKQYLLANWEDHTDFLEKLAKRNGKLRKGGEPDLNSVAVSVINDWQRGKLPYFVAPPRSDDAGEEEGDENAQPLTRVKGASDGIEGLDGELADNSDEEGDDAEEEEEVAPKKKAKKTAPKKKRKRAAEPQDDEGEGGDWNTV